MTVVRSVQLEETERTLMRLRKSAGLYQSLVREDVVSDPDRSTLRMGTWMMVLGYTEFYVDGILESLFARAASALAPGPQFLMQREAPKSQTSWEARRDALKNVFAIQSGQFKSWNRLDGAIWVRNSIAHGSGGLTRMQKLSEAAKAEKVGVAVIDGKLYLSHEAIGLCASTCCEFVGELDLAARGLV